MGLRRHHWFASVCVVCMGMLIYLAGAAEPESGRTLRSLGAIGDGVTDDRRAIEAALNGARGARVDGEGRSYAVYGNIHVETDVDFHNATLIQTMSPPETGRYLDVAGRESEQVVEPTQALLRMVQGFPLLGPEGVAHDAAVPPLTEEELAALRRGLVIRTLGIEGQESQPVAVRLSQIKIVRGQHADAGGSNDAVALRIRHGAPVRMEGIEITGDGHGIGLCVLESRDVRIEKIHLHDMTWAPYQGDHVLDTLTTQSLRDEFAWNDFPLYELHDESHRFVQRRAREQIVGMYVGRSRDVVIHDARIERLRARIGDHLHALQSDGITLNRVDDIVLRNCVIEDVWEGIDFTGADGNGFRYEDCTITRALGTAFKFVYLKRNGTLINCTAREAGQNGFSIGRLSEQIELVNCRALETGAMRVYTKTDDSRVATICGFDIAGSPGAATPKAITLRGCSAVNTLHPGTMDYGLRCEAPPAGRAIDLIDCHAAGARISDIAGFSNE